MLLNNRNVKSETDFLKQVQNLDVLNINLIKMFSLSIFIFGDFLWCNHVLWIGTTKLSEVSTDICPSLSVALNPVYMPSKVVTWFQESIFVFGKYGLIKRIIFLNHLLSWSIQTGPSLIATLPILRSLATHWGRVTHICASTLTIIDSDNGLSPGGRQAIIWTSAGILLIGTLEQTSMKS